MAVGCSHGAWIDRRAADAVLEFKRRYKPHVTVHLGDALDMTAFRSGAAGSKDEAEPIAPDMDAGLQFIRRLEPQVWLMGNHEDRLYRLRDHPKAIVSELAGMLVGEIESECRKLKCVTVPYHYKQAYRLGNYSLMHGWFFNENAARDHAEAFGNVIFAHTHRAGMAKGRRADSPTGYCVGTLMRVEHAEYAKGRRATLGWSQGFVWSEFTDSQAVVWLHEQPQGSHTWRLPL